VAALRFSKDANNTVSITLSMLTTFLSEEDEAFMAMLDCLRDEAKVTSMWPRAPSSATPNSQVLSTAHETSLVRTAPREEENRHHSGEHEKEFYGSIVGYVGPRLEKANRSMVF